ncbi:MAG: hypothetical protein NTU53_24975 [Planctomycetota bacterium]|nr:hypothetical protein [Planctomycetota bacterium]
MKLSTIRWAAWVVGILGLAGAPVAAEGRKTVVDIKGEGFFINGKPTYEGRVWRGMKIEGLLLNSRMVQGIFDDRNPETRKLWDYPDGKWDPERNTSEFIEAMPSWRKAGLLCFTINLQGGSPQGYSSSQPWWNSAIDLDGSLRADYMGRLERILDRADELGMVVILGYFYFGQEPRFEGEGPIVKATENATDWLLSKAYRNVLVEIANECDVSRYKNAIVKPGRVHELIEMVQKRSAGKVKNEAGRLLVSVSYGGGTIPRENVVRGADFLLVHGNGVGEPRRIREMVDKTRAVGGYRGQPILFNEDDHFDFEKADNNFVGAVSKGASWGYFDFRMKGEGFDDGYQSVPTNWKADGSERKRGFFKLLSEMSGAGGK